MAAEIDSSFGDKKKSGARRDNALSLPKAPSGTIPQKELLNIAQKALAISQTVVQGIGFAKREVPLRKGDAVAVCGWLREQFPQPLHMDIDGITLKLERLGINLLLKKIRDNSPPEIEKRLTKVQRDDIDGMLCESLRAAKFSDGTIGYDPRSWQLPTKGDIMSTLAIPDSPDLNLAVKVWMLDCVVSLMEIQDRRLIAKAEQKQKSPMLVLNGVRKAYLKSVEEQT